VPALHKGCQPKEVLTPDQMTVERSIMAGLITYTYGRLTPIGAKKIGRLELANKWQMIGFDGRPGAPCPYTWGYTGSGGGWPMIEGKDFLLSPFPRQAFNQRWWEENWSDKHWMTHHTGERWNLWRYEPYFSRDSVWLDNKSKPGELGVMADFVPLRASYNGDLVDSLFDRRWANEPHLESIQLPKEKCRWDTDGDGNCAFHPLGCPA